MSETTNTIERPYRTLGMDSLARLIKRDWDGVAYAEWQIRYGHDFPVYAVINGSEVRFEQ